MGLLSLTELIYESVTKIISLKFVNMVTLKAPAKHELLLNKPATRQVTIINVTSILANDNTVNCANGNGS